jgi:acetate kinase
VALGELKLVVVRILTVNAGSTSLKIERYDVGDVLGPLAEPPAPAYEADITAGEMERGLHDATHERVDVVAHRFVRLPDGSPPVLVLDAKSVATIRSVGGEAPLHDAPALASVTLLERLVPGLLQLAVSDSAYHRTMPAAASTYALPAALTRSGLHRLGFHGLSHEYAAHRGCALAGLDVARSRIITAHLGGGSSLCAIQGGRSIDTTMGYTPLEGLPMATRSGSVDPGLLIHLLRAGMSVDALEQMLERHSGLLGISELSGDLRELLAASDTPGPGLALDVLAWRLRASLGAMNAVLGGAHLVVFTGGIGEHAASVRAAAFAGGLGVGASLDAERNAAGGEGRIDTYSGAPAVCVVTAREGWQLARAAVETRKPAE